MMSRFLITLCLISMTAASAHAQALDNRTISQRLDRMEENIQLVQRQLALGGSDSSGNPNPAAARLAVQIGEMENDTRAIRGQIEDTDYKIRQLTDKLDRLQKDTDFRLRELEKPGAGAAMNSSGGMSTPPVPINTAQGAASEDGSWQGGEETDEGAHEKPQAPEQRKPVNETQEKPEAEFPSARDHYNAAFKLMNQTKYDDAAESFSKFVQIYPKDALVGNAYYWLGETSYVRKDYLKAADDFRQGFEAQPAGPKASDNLLKLAMSLGALDKKTEACVVLKQVIAKFGSTSSTAKQKAETEMGRMECSN